MSKKISSSSQGKKYKLKTHLYPVSFTTDNHVEKMLIKNKKCTRTHTHTHILTISFLFLGNKKKNKTKRKKTKSASKITGQQFTREAKNGLKSLNPQTEPPPNSQKWRR